MDIENIKVWRVGRHIVFWVVYIALNAVVVSVERHQPLEKVFWSASLTELIALPVKIALTYWIFYYLIPRYMDDRMAFGRMILYGCVGFFVAVVLYRLNLAYVYAPLMRPDRPMNWLSTRGILLGTFDIFITLGAALSIKLLRLQAKSHDEARQLQQEKMQSELNFLRTQTNPHFLFNTLNNLYGLARKKSDLTPHAILMLSKIMRFMLYDCRAPRIPVTAEAKVIQDYIELEKLRYNERLNIHYEENIDDPHMTIAPLLMLPFVENSFKHGARTSTEEVKIGINISLKAGNLCYTVKNTAPEPEPPPETEIGRIGLFNVKRQLELIYPNNYVLETGWADGWYTVDMKIEL